MAQNPKPAAPRTKEEQKHLDEMDKKIAEFESWAQRELHLPPLTKEDLARAKDPQNTLADLTEKPANRK